MAVPRPILMWIQSLDLERPITKPRRDFSNGYLIAEIHSRYYPVEMHRFQNGNSMTIKQDNWEQLAKIHKKYNVNLEVSIESVMAAENDAHIHLLRQLYDHYHPQQKLTESKALAPTQAAPPSSYMQPTATQVIRNLPADTTGDEKKQNALVKAKLNEYNQMSIQKRADDHAHRQRIMPAQKNTGVTQEAASDVTKPVITVKVKKYENNIGMLIDKKKKSVASAQFSHQHPDHQEQENQ